LGLVKSPAQIRAFINLNSAKALGLAVPNSLQLLADSVIE
jgi:hypothetical protein